MAPDATARWPLPEPYDFFETTRMLRTGERDPTVRRTPDGLWRTAHTDDGPVTVRIIVDDAVQADAWGPGAGRVMEDIPRWIGLHEAPWTLPPHPVTDRLLRAHPGLRGTDTRDVFEALLNVVLQQRVTWEEAAMTWRRLCDALGEPAPGPVSMLLSPTRRAVFRAGVLRLQAAGVGFGQARTLIEIARVAPSLQSVAELPTDQASAALQSVPGVGPWTAAVVLAMRFARPEPVLLGDYHMPDMVAWALAGEPRGTEERMLALLAPFEGHSALVLRLLVAARMRAPRRGSKRAWRRVR